MNTARVTMTAALLLASVAAMFGPSIGFNVAPAPAPAPSPANGFSKNFKDVLPPEPYPGCYKYLDSCTSHFSKKCGLDLSLDLVFNAQRLDYGCCQELINKIWWWKLLVEPRIRFFPPGIFQRGPVVWNSCVHLAAAPAPSPSSD